METMELKEIWKPWNRKGIWKPWNRRKYGNPGIKGNMETIE